MREVMRVAKMEREWRLGLDIAMVTKPGGRFTQASTNMLPTHI